MDVLKTNAQIKKNILKAKNNNNTIGFVPTMGAIHEGHLSLIRCAKRKTDYVVVSIFVNPTQFNDSNDFKKYPRDPKKDIKKIGKENIDVIFFPSEHEIYPEKDTRIFDFGKLDKVMEGKHRKGHFNGVAQVVSKLFEIIKPDKAYFGLKDFQQYAIINKLVKKYMPDLKIEIIGCPIIREPDGLAMSSRNLLLDKEQRKNANKIYETLKKAVELSKTQKVEEVKKFVKTQIKINKYLKLEYFEIVNDKNLEPIKNWEEKNNKIGCIAAYCGNIRLIDNIYFDKNLK